MSAEHLQCDHTQQRGGTIRIPSMRINFTLSVRFNVLKIDNTLNKTAKIVQLFPCNFFLMWPLEIVKALTTNN